MTSAAPYLSSRCLVVYGNFTSAQFLPPLCGVREDPKGGLLKGEVGARLFCLTGNFASQDLICFCEAFARICCLRESPQDLLVILQGESDSLRKSPQNFHTNCADKCQNPGSRNSLGRVERCGGRVRRLAWLSCPFRRFPILPFCRFTVLSLRPFHYVSRFPLRRFSRKHRF